MIWGISELSKQFERKSDNLQVSEFAEVDDGLIDVLSHF